MTEVIPRAPSTVRDMTVYNLLPLWMDNLAENLPYIRGGPHYLYGGLDAHDLPKQTGPAIIIGAGPSLSAYKHLQQIKRSGWKHAIFVCDKLIGEVLRIGIKPNYVATIDGSPLINNFFNRKEVKKHAKDITGVFNVLTHPSVIQTWINAGGRPWWFVSAMDDPDPETGKLGVRCLTVIMYHLSKGKGIIDGVGNVGAFMWNLASALDYSPIILVGFDFSEHVKDKSQAIYFDMYTRWYLQAYSKKYADDPNVDIGKRAQDTAATLHQPETNPDFVAPFTKLPYFKKGEHPKYLANPMWKYYRDSLAMHIVTSKIHTINCTGNGCIHTEAKDGKGNYILKVPNFESANLEETLKKYA